MKGTLAEFNQIVEAEQYFEFFQLSYDPQVVNVNRLHILQKFSEYIQNIEAASTTSTEAERLDEYRAALERAYSLFLTSTALEQKLFKVFQHKPQNIVLLSELKTD